MCVEINPLGPPGAVLTGRIVLIGISVLCAITNKVPSCNGLTALYAIADAGMLFGLCVSICMLWPVVQLPGHYCYKCQGLRKEVPAASPILYCMM